MRAKPEFNWRGHKLLWGMLSENARKIYTIIE